MNIRFVPGDRISYTCLPYSYGICKRMKVESTLARRGSSPADVEKSTHLFIGLSGSMGLCSAVLPSSTANKLCQRACSGSEM